MEAPDPVVHHTGVFIAYTRHPKGQKFGVCYYISKTRVEKSKKNKRYYFHPPFDNAAQEWSPVLMNSLITNQARFDIFLFPLLDRCEVL